MGAGMAAIAQLILINVDGSAEWIQQNIYSDQVLSSLGTMIVFLVTLRLGSNLTRNGAIIGHFGNLCGACVNLAIWSRSLVTSGKLDVFNAIVGAPQLMASSTGRPNPSLSDGKTNNAAER